MSTKTETGYKARKAKRDRLYGPCLTGRDIDLRDVQRITSAVSRIRHRFRDPNLAVTLEMIEGERNGR